MLLEIPDDFVDRNIYIFAGLDLVARCKDGKWEVKAKSCSRCGRCCKKIREDHPLGSPTGCRYLEQESGGERLCGLGIFRPHGCAIADGSHIKVESCSVKWVDL